MRPASGDEIDRTRPGLMAVALRHAHIDRKVGAARERYNMIDGKAPAPVPLGQTIDADPPAEAAAVENNRVVSKRREIDLAGDDVGIERERAAPPRARCRCRRDCRSSPKSKTARCRLRFPRPFVPG